MSVKEYVSAVDVCLPVRVCPPVIVRCFSVWRVRFKVTLISLGLFLPSTLTISVSLDLANSVLSVPRAELINPLSPLDSLGPPTPLPPPPPPGLPTYEQALAASGVHDAPPPPYTSLRRPR